jgi:hypothetical protein
MYLRDACRILNVRIYKCEIYEEAHLAEGEEKESSGTESESAQEESK